MSKNGVVIIQFSPRKNGNCAAISRNIQDFYGEITAYTVDASVTEPCGGCNYECLMPGKACPNLSVKQTEIMEAICNAKLAYFIVPNYCGFPCASYFAFNEKSVGFFNKNEALLEAYLNVPKRFIIVSNTEDDVFVKAMQQQTNAAPEILYLKSRKYGKQSIAGNILDSEAARANLEAFLASSPDPTL